MQATFVVWFVGGVLAGVAYLVVIVRPEYRKHQGTGVLVEVFHFGPRVAMVFLLWPARVFIFSGVLLNGRGRT